MRQRWSDLRSFPKWFPKRRLDEESGLRDRGTATLLQIHRRYSSTMMVLTVIPHRFSPPPGWNLFWCTTGAISSQEKERFNRFFHPNVVRWRNNQKGGVSFQPLEHPARNIKVLSRNEKQNSNPNCLLSHSLASLTIMRRWCRVHSCETSVLKCQVVGFVASLNMQMREDHKNAFNIGIKVIWNWTIMPILYTYLVNRIFFFLNIPY